MTWMRGARRHCTADICEMAIEVLSCLKTEGLSVVRRQRHVCRAVLLRATRLDH